jgi:hypothetical protein
MHKMSLPPASMVGTVIVEHILAAAAAADVEMG